MERLGSCPVLGAASAPHDVCGCQRRTSAALPALSQGPADPCETEPKYCPAKRLEEQALGSFWRQI